MVAAAQRIPAAVPAIIVATGDPFPYRTPRADCIRDSMKYCEWLAMKTVLMSKWVSSLGPGAEFVFAVAIFDQAQSKVNT
jgi:hypothetical protein